MSDRLRNSSIRAYSSECPRASRHIWRLAKGGAPGVRGNEWSGRCECCGLYAILPAPIGEELLRRYLHRETGVTITDITFTEVTLQSD